ncbi:MAG: hypothetical protein ACLRY6_13155 [[Clostridium] innocuum]
METAKRQAQLLHLYLLELKNTLKKMDALHCVAEKSISDEAEPLSWYCRMLATACSTVWMHSLYSLLLYPVYS